MLQDQSYHFLYALSSREKQEEYFKMKNKYEHAFSKEEKTAFQQKVLQDLEQFEDWKNAKLIFLPETGNTCLIEIAQQSGKEIVYIKKQTKETIKNSLDKQAMMKAEREKLYLAIDSMNTVKMAGVAGNQRKRLVEVLFEDIVLTPEQEEYSKVFLDDSIFSGYTFLAAQYKINQVTNGNHSNIVLFNKQQ